MDRDIPVSAKQAQRVARWMCNYFMESILDAVKGTPFTPSLIIGIVCQETAYAWLEWVDKVSPADILARCVLDACGDAPGTDRGAFPRNTSAFRKKFGGAFTEMLIAEANKTRALRGFGPKAWVYKGYGLYQYDLQFVLDDQDFFLKRQWYDHGQCLRRVMKELTGNFDRLGDVGESIRAYNGTGPRAEHYRENVLYYASIVESEL